MKMDALHTSGLVQYSSNCGSCYRVKCVLLSTNVSNQRLRGTVHQCCKRAEGFTTVHKDVQQCTRMYNSTQRCTTVHKDVQQYTRMYNSAQGCIQQCIYMYTKDQVQLLAIFSPKPYGDIEKMVHLITVLQIELVIHTLLLSNSYRELC